MTPVEPPPSRTIRIRRVIYLIVIALLAGFLWQLGLAPWRHAAAQWHIMLLLAGLSAFGLAVQAMAFRMAVPETPPPRFSTTLAIWSVSAAVSVVAPLVAGLAARTTLLMHHGMRLSTCAVASLRQLWLGLEYALLLSALALPFSGWSVEFVAAAACGGGWVAMRVVRCLARGQSNSQVHGRLGHAIEALRAPVPKAAHPWFALQLLTMSAVYLVGFNGLGAAITVPQAVALSGLTVALSLIAFVPNGLGITDTLWVLFAQSAGLQLEEAVAIAIAIRLGHLLAASLLAALLHSRIYARPSV